MSEQADALIIGAGPAGSALGLLLARQGLRVVIVDRARFPRDKPCAGALTAAGIDAVRAVFGDDALRRATCATTAAARFYHALDLIAEVGGLPPMVHTDRRDMDAIFLSLARDAGCEVIEGDAAVTADVGQGSVILASGRTLRAPILMGADGAHSIVRSALLGPTPSRRHGFGLVADLPCDLIRPEERDSIRAAVRIHLHLLPWGYGWVFPKGDRVSIGVGALIRERAGFRTAFDELVRTICIPDAPRVQPRGGVIPLGNFTRRPGRRRVLLIGDAAGLVEPVTGEGILFAIRSAQLAAPAIAEALAAGDPSRAGRLYTAACRRALFSRLRHARWARLLLFPRICAPLAAGRLRRHPDLVRGFYDVLAGRLSYPRYLARVFFR